jgi:hypothetical protein
MLRPSPKSEQVFQEIMGEQTNMSRKYNVRPRKQVDYEKQGHMIQGNVDIQRNVYEK